MIIGFHAATEFIKHNSQLVDAVMLDKDRKDARLQGFVKLLEGRHLYPKWVDKAQLDKVAKNAHHQGVVLVTKQLLQSNLAAFEDILALNKPNKLVLLLDEVTDPHNVGASLRVANGFAVDAVIVPKNNACGLTDTVRKVASGAAELIPFVTVTNLVRTIDELKDNGFFVAGLTHHANTAINHFSLNNNIALVVGGEQKGLRELTMKHCDVLVKIAMLGGVESFNVSNAAAIAIYEIRKQQGLF